MPTSYRHELEDLASSRASRVGSLILFTILVLIGVAVYWASISYIEKVTRGEGRVVPASRTQVIQSLEGGIVSQIQVREGGLVRAGDPMIVLDDTQFRSQLGETDARRFSLEATISRLSAEVAGTEPDFSDALRDRYPDTVQNEINVLDARRLELSAAVRVIDQQISQKRAEISELRERIDQLNDAVVLVKEEVALVEPFVEMGVQSQVALIRLQRELNEAEGQLSTTREGLNRARAALGEAEERKIEQAAIFQTRAREELAKAEAELNSVQEALVGDEDRVNRSTLSAPVDGIVNNLTVSTLGQVVNPGEQVAEIIPIDDSLLVEVKIAPSDIGFLRPDLPAKVRISAYDFAVFGSLQALVETIAADSFEDEQGNQFYKVWVRTDDVLRDTQGEVMPIIPGMTATIDIIVGEGTVIGYFLDPILRAREMALREQ